MTIYIYIIQVRYILSQWMNKYAFPYNSRKCGYGMYTCLTHWILLYWTEIFEKLVFKLNSGILWLWYLLWNFPPMNVTGPFWWYIIIDSGNGLVPPDNKPYLIQFWHIFMWPYGATWPQCVNNVDGLKTYNGTPPTNYQRKCAVKALSLDWKT